MERTVADQLLEGMVVDQLLEGTVADQLLGFSNFRKYVYLEK